MLYNLIMLLLTALGVAAAYLIGRGARRGERADRKDESPPEEQQRLMREYLNFLSYTGERQDEQ